MYDHHTDHPEAAGKVIHILTLHFFAWVWEIQVLTAFAFGVPLLVNPTHALYCFLPFLLWLPNSSYHCRINAQVAYQLFISPPLPTRNIPVLQFQLTFLQEGKGTDQNYKKNKHADQQGQIQAAWTLISLATAKFPHHAALTILFTITFWNTCTKFFLTPHALLNAIKFPQLLRNFYHPYSWCAIYSQHPS